MKTNSRLGGWVLLGAAVAVAAASRDTGPWQIATYTAAGVALAGYAAGRVWLRRNPR